MGSCNGKLHLTEDLVLSLTTSSDPTKELLQLNLFYNHYDRDSKLKIDQMTAQQIAKASEPTSKTASV